MKKKLLNSVLLFFAILIANIVAAQTAATATWTLSNATQQTAAVVGNITATDQTLGSAVVGTQYGSNYTIGGVTNSGWQRTGITGGVPTAYNADGYIDYKVTPSGGQFFTMTLFEAELLGGGTGLGRAALYWSTDNFVTSQTVGTCSYNSTTVAGTTDAPLFLVSSSSAATDGIQKLSVPTFISVAPTQTLIVRLYVWCGSANKYLASKNIKITGVTSAASLPLKLNNFSISIQNEKPKLIWATTNEVNMQGFDIEKSLDGVSFKTISSINASNAANNSYNYIDNEFTKQTSYYRLKVTDKDGKFFYSHVITYSSKTKDELSVYPNPANGVITIKHPIISSEKAVISVFGIDGKLLKQISPINKTTQSFIDISLLESGNYLIQLTDGKFIIATKVSKY